MNVGHEAVPGGCLGCNPDEIGTILERRGIKLEEVPRHLHESSDVIPCQKCGRVWVVMPRASDQKKPVA